jgi:DNA mismatch endonuclease, patch repair protein
MDSMTPEQRSKLMGRIRSRDTLPEKIVRSILHQLGYRFRLHSAELPGKPDIVLPRYGSVVFVHGCFWHRHKGCPYSYTPKTRTEFWQAKFESNVRRDQSVTRSLRRAGWQVIVVWECQLRYPDKVALRLNKRLQASSV